MSYQQDPVFKQLQRAEETFWRNPHYTHFAQAKCDTHLNLNDILEAEARLQRFAPYFQAAFPETIATHGIIESPLYHLEKMQNALACTGQLWLKADNELPISGSIKARGGIYEVLQFAEKLALENKIIKPNDNYALLNNTTAKALFSRYTVAVGSTGNLGMAIGIMAAKLGFQAAVHMSADAKTWKKQLLRSHGVQVFEYSGDYSLAVKQGREQIQAAPHGYFVDDEHSQHLFLGYAVAGLRLKRQFDALGIAINATQPLYVYLPCGVGGAPCGVAFGLKWAFGDDVHCVFAEPTQSPCMMLGVMTGLHDGICVQDIGLTNQTLADGLAVGRASGFAGRALQRAIHSFYTVEDKRLFEFLKQVYTLEHRRLEPSACAGFAGIALIQAAENVNLNNAIHLVWATGGHLMPDEIFADYLMQAA